MAQSVPTERRKKVVIMGAAGMDYNLFNRKFRDDPAYEVVAFTMAAEQNLGTTTADGEALRPFPRALAGAHYSKDIPTIYERDMAAFVAEHGVDLVAFAYSDLSHVELMHKASEALAAGADFFLPAPRKIQIKSRKPVVSVCAVRTGIGKSSVSREVVRLLQAKGLRVVAIREPMPYGDLVKQNVMRFATREDLVRHEATIEEEEEYLSYVDNGMVIYAGVDYEKIVRQAEQEADAIVWDGGNNEISFYESDLLMVLADPLRRGHEDTYYPGETNVRMADAFLLAKCHEASPHDIASVEETLLRLKPGADVVHLRSVTRLEHPAMEPQLRGKRALVLDDGPTLTHGGTKFGAGWVMADKLAMDIVDPKPQAVGAVAATFREFPHLERVIPAMGYSPSQLADLAATINAVDADYVVNGSPADLGDHLREKVNKPIVRVLYDVAPSPGGTTTLQKLIDEFCAKHFPA